MVSTVSGDAQRKSGFNSRNQDAQVELVIVAMAGRGYAHRAKICPACVNRMGASRPHRSNAGCDRARFRNASKSAVDQQRDENTGACQAMAIRLWVPGKQALDLANDVSGYEASVLRGSVGKATKVARCTGARAAVSCPQPEQEFLHAPHSLFVWFHV